MPDKKVTILVVDDSDLIRHTLTNFFDDYFIEVVNCMDGLEGIQKALKYTPDLIFLDLMMPNFDGVKMLQVIKVIDTLKNIPVIVISGNTSKANVLAATEAGAHRVIPKPLEKEVIINNINEILGVDFLKNAKKINTAEDENKQILNQLLKIFLAHYPLKKQKIERALELKNKDLLYSQVHEMKGAGGTIGYPIISVICNDIEKALEIPAIDWENMKSKCSQIFTIVGKIEDAKTISGNTITYLKK
jgi:two-component system chemotaxis response regulator CheY